MKKASANWVRFLHICVKKINILGRCILFQMISPNFTAKEMGKRINSLFDPILLYNLFCRRIDDLPSSSSSNWTRYFFIFRLRSVLFPSLSVRYSSQLLCTGNVCGSRALSFPALTVCSYGVSLSLSSCLHWQYSPGLALKNPPKKTHPKKPT